MTEDESNDDLSDEDQLRKDYDDSNEETDEDIELDTVEFDLSFFNPEDGSLDVFIKEADESSVISALFNYSEYLEFLAQNLRGTAYTLLSNPELQADVCIEHQKVHITGPEELIDELKEENIFISNDPTYEDFMKEEESDEDDEDFLKGLRND